MINQNSDPSKKKNSNPTPIQVQCATCPVHNAANLRKLGVDMENWDYVVALAGNPNVGKSTVFNALTGLKQHTGNWPGKTVSRAEGGFELADHKYKLVDLPGTYSLLATSLDEEIARDFILFAQPDVTVVVVDATRLERNLNLVLQILQITDRVVVCLNLIDEAKRHGLTIDERRLARDLGVPVIPTIARKGIGLNTLIQSISDVANGKTVCKPYRIQNEPPLLKKAIDQLEIKIRNAYPHLPNARWVALRLLDGDEQIIEAIKKDEIGDLRSDESQNNENKITHQTEENKRISPKIDQILATAIELRWQIGGDFHEQLMETIYGEAARFALRAVTRPDEKPRFDIDRKIDEIVTSKTWGIPIMLLLLAIIFWLTIIGANYPSKLLYDLLIGKIYPSLHVLASNLNIPEWLSGLTIDGMYLATAWVISVMLPPMAIFFPLFTLLEDFGYLPRVAFNLDNIFKKSGAHGKQALSMMMGFGCNAAGVISTRIIDSPRERLIAIITNNFSLCNGRWPTQILIASLFIGALAPAHFAGLISSIAVLGITLLGVFLTFATSWTLSRTVLKGEVSTYSLELPPYRPPRFFYTIYTSLIDRTLNVLWRAIVFALPAGAAIWIITNIQIHGISIAEYLINFLNPLGLLIGLNGIILLAYIVAIPANEIVIPTILMLTVLVTGFNNINPEAGTLFEADENTTRLLLQAGGWSLLTAINLMLFSSIHNPCSTTIFTIYKETGSKKWTIFATLMPVFLGFTITFFVAQIWRLIDLIL